MIQVIVEFFENYIAIFYFYGKNRSTERFLQKSRQSETVDFSIAF